MRVALERIGNSRGIRIPKPMIEHCGFGDTVDLRMELNRVVISPHRSPREGWAEAFEAAGAAAADELLLDAAARNAFSDEEWRW